MKRLGYLLKLDFQQNLKAFIWTSVTMLLVYLFFFWWAHNIGIPLDSYSLSKGLFSPEHIALITKAQCESVGRFGSVAMYFCFIVIASQLYGKEQKKQIRTAFLMLPATNLEKFLSRWLYMIVFSIVAGILTFFVADVLHMIWLSSADRPIIAASKYFFEPLADGDWRFVFFVYAFLIFIHSAYLFGGIFLHKHHFAVTSLLLVILGGPFMKLINFIELSVFSFSTSPGYLVCVCLVCAIILFTWLSYRVFCRWQLTTRKNANL